MTEQIGEPRKKGSALKVVLIVVGVVFVLLLVLCLALGGGAYFFGKKVIEETANTKSFADKQIEAAQQYAAASVRMNGLQLAWAADPEKGKSLHARGSVTNGGNQTLEYVNIVVKFKGSDGSVLGEDETLLFWVDPMFGDTVTFGPGVTKQFDAVVKNAPESWEAAWGYTWTYGNCTFAEPPSSGGHDHHDHFD